MTEHVVSRAEDLEQILAREYPWLTVADVIDHADNAPLFTVRRATVLRQGDRFTVPDGAAEQQEFSGAGDKRHRFRYTPRLRPLAVKILAHDGSALAGESYELQHGETIMTGSTGGDGFIRVEIPIAWLALELRVAGRTRKLRIAALDPVTTMRGVQARLYNLGFDTGPIDGNFGLRTARALRAFQAANGLTETGHGDRATRDKLKSVHGS
ncbi:MAG: peptidoglycan-binding protein [Deltaproteobacteria bacterium]|nr:peptidoglycan-binding protein [Nannocystaceae bacterium]